jgi:hypothetical protein
MFYKCRTSAFCYKPSRMLRKYFSKYCSCHLQGKYVLVHRFLSLCRAGSKHGFGCDGVDWLQKQQTNNLVTHTGDGN